MMKIKFPNPFGYALVEEKIIKKLQSDYGFSDDYANFLQTQNGFVEDSFLESEDAESWLEKDDDDTEAGQDCECLYGIVGDDDDYDLKSNQSENIFKDIFFVIGVDHAGNEFVEILVGENKGWIGCLDRDYYMSSENLKEFLLEMLEDGDEDLINNVKKNKVPLEDIANFLATEDVGLMALHAESMNDFVNKCFTFSDEDEGVFIKYLV